MPGIPLIARETSYSRSAEQMCHHDTLPNLSEEEKIAAEESLSLYCKPVELYNILQRRAIQNPSFLQRCLHYKIQGKHKRRIQMTISLPVVLTERGEDQNLFPLYILLGRLVSDVTVSEYYEVYRFNRVCILNNSIGVDGSAQSQVNFTLPEINKLALKAKSGSLAILLVSYANVGGYCLWGKISLESLYTSWENSPNLCFGQRVEVMSTVEMRPCFSKSNCSSEDKCISFHVPSSNETGNASQQVQVIISAEEFGAKERSPYNSYTYSGIPPSSLPHIMRLRAGNVIYNYRYYNNKVQKTEVTEDFSCPFCLVKCSSFKGLRYHLPSSHDLFNFEFWVTEEYQAVNVSVKTDIWRFEIVADGVDPKQQTFYFCSKPLRRGRTKYLIHNANHTFPLVLESELPAEINDPKADGLSKAMVLSYPDPECIQSIPGNHHLPSAVLQFAKTRKLSIERSEPRNRALLQKRKFFHSHRAQPMALEQVLSDRDSEDEVDDDVADFEDRRMLDDFVDVTKDEKQMMHMWNSFVRKQRVLADSHIPWACEAFSRLHKHDLELSPALMWCWRLFLIKLWNHGLLDARTMNNCNILLEKSQEHDSDQTKPENNMVCILAGENEG